MDLISRNTVIEQIKEEENRLLSEMELFEKIQDVSPELVFIKYNQALVELVKVREILKSVTNTTNRNNEDENNEAKKLKPCPFCEGEAKLKIKELYDAHIECTQCGCGTKTFNEYWNVRDYASEQMKAGKVDSVVGIIQQCSIKKAVEAWNRRCCD